MDFDISAGWKSLGLFVDVDLSMGHHAEWQPASALISGWAGKRTGCVAAGCLTCAMPEPISPPPMTVTCLTTIFFAEAEAVDEEAMARMNCLVTKAMVRKRKGRWSYRRRRRWK